MVLLGDEVCDALGVGGVPQTPRHVEPIGDHPESLGQSTVSVVACREFHPQEERAIERVRRVLVGFGLDDLGAGLEQEARDCGDNARLVGAGDQETRVCSVSCNVGAFAGAAVVLMRGAASSPGRRPDGCRGRLRQPWTRLT